MGEIPGSSSAIGGYRTSFANELDINDYLGPCQNHEPGQIFIILYPGLQRWLHEVGKPDICGCTSKVNARLDLSNL
jgi:hypothetical protein